MRARSIHKVNIIFAIILLCLSTALARSEEPIRFGRDILPILSTHCYACHGPDESERKGDLRLDLEEDTKRQHGDGIPVVAGELDKSSLWKRIQSTDPDLQMPPPDAHQELKPREVELLKRWIVEGAAWGKHWSFEAIVRPEISTSSTSKRVSPIDALVAREAKKHGLTIQPKANPYTLVRRLWLDVLGMPPSPEVADQFAMNPTDQAYELMVDQLLASPQFGEHWARMWMDLARYADTKGYEKDLGRTMWPYRDWLVRSINADMSLEQMTVEQLAGDLLPNPTLDQQVATAFHRNTMSNDEGGTDDEEFRTIAIKDRIDTTMQVWMGLTAGCAKCHSHKYDPISQTEYYRLFAVFNQTEDADRYDDAPTLELANNSVKEFRKRFDEKIALATRARDEADIKAAADENKRWTLPRLVKSLTSSGAAIEQRPDQSLIVDGAAGAEDVYTLEFALPLGMHRVLRLEALPEKYSDGQVGLGRNPRDPNFVLSELEVEVLGASDTETKRLKLANPRADFEQGGWPITAALDGDTKTGWAVSPKQRERHVAFFDFEEPLVVEKEISLKITLKQHYGDSLTLRTFRLGTIGEETSKVQLPQPTDEQKKANDELASSNKALQDFLGTLPRIPIMKALSKDRFRTTQVHRRGNFLDLGDTVQAGLPTAFPLSKTLAADATVDRLELAKWLMQSDNPLTARVWANRIWSRVFGMGIVETEEDFGALGAAPSNPELLDWLAAEYRDNGWSLKKYLKTVLLTETYRQASEVSPLSKEKDPRNQWWARGSRYRLTGEAIRDSALVASGLLSKKMEGPPVMPPQPEGLWRSTYNGQKWVNAQGEDRYRRALYTYLKRTTPYPSMTTFDGGSGEVCQIRRIRTNTPLQALVTLNDPVYLESAAGLARRMINHDTSVQRRIERGIRLTLIRPVRSGETSALEKLYRDILTRFQNSPGETKAMLTSGYASSDPTSGIQIPAGISEAEFATWMVVANTLLNLDEFLTRN